MRKVIQTVSILLCTLGCEGRADPCKLPAEKISLSILDQTKFYSTENRETSTRIYLGLCHVLDKLDENISKICDKNAFACVTKFDKGKALTLGVLSLILSFISRRERGGVHQERRHRHRGGTEGDQQQCRAEVLRWGELCQRVQSDSQLLHGYRLHLPAGQNESP